VSLFLAPQAFFFVNHCRLHHFKVQLCILVVWVLWGLLVSCTYSFGLKINNTLKGIGSIIVVVNLLNWTVAEHLGSLSIPILLHSMSLVRGLSTHNYLPLLGCCPCAYYLIFRHRKRGENWVGSRMLFFPLSYMLLLKRPHDCLKLNITPNLSAGNIQIVNCLVESLSEFSLRHLALWRGNRCLLVWNVLPLELSYWLNRSIYCPH